MASALFCVPLDADVASAGGHDAPRKWTATTAQGTRSVVRTARTRLRLVAHAPPQANHDDDSRAHGADVELASAIVDFAFSQCGEFLAVADAGGVLHLVKSDGARELFAYPIVAPSSIASDSIQAVAFVAAVGKRDAEAEEPEDLLVLTRAGVLIRLGNLRLAEIERTFAREASHNVALRTIMASIHLQQTNVGRLREGARSVLLGRRYSSSLFVTIANHEDVLRVWRVDTRGWQMEASIRRIAAYSDLFDGTAVSDAQFCLSDRCLAVLSEGGSLSWWDWRALVLLDELHIEGVKTFAALSNPAFTHGNSIETRSCAVALNCEIGVQSVESSIQVVQVEYLFTSRSSHITATFSVPSTNVVAISAFEVSAEDSHLLVTCVGDGAVKASAVNLRSVDDDNDYEPAAADDTHRVALGVQCSQELRAIDLSLFQDQQSVTNFEEKLKGWFSTIGRELEDSRLTIESLVDFSKRLRQAQASPGKFSLLLEQRVPEWLDQIASVSYRWTTFTLLLSTVTVSSSASQPLSTRWREFGRANLLDVMCHYLKRGMMRAVSLLWQRHTHTDALHHIDVILDSVPQDLPFGAYEQWLRGDVVPGIVTFVERGRNLKSSSVAEVVEKFASWTIKRIKQYAEKSDLDTALKLCNLLNPNSESFSNCISSDVSMRWASLRLLVPSTRLSSEKDTQESSLELIDRLSQQLGHMKYLEAQHSFKISLDVFVQETPVTIAMSMLDRCTSAETVPTEVQQHIIPYLRYVGQGMDAVLVEYVTEAVESAPTTTSPSEQARLIAIIEEIVDVENRTSVTLLFFGSLLPPFSVHVKQFTRTCVEWDTRQIDVVQEHVRLMEIQDMLTSYGVARFQVGDARSGSRMVSHILAQITRESAFSDALQLVQAYSHLSVERAALEYFENMFTIESSNIGLTNDAEASRRSSSMKAAIRHLKANFASSGMTWKVASVLQETVELGLCILETKEAEAEAKDRSVRAHLTGALTDELFLKVLEASLEVFVAELVDVEVPSTDDKWGNGNRDGSSIDEQLVLDIQRIRRMHSEWGVLVSVNTMRNPDRVSERVRAFIQPGTMFSITQPSQEVPKRLNSMPVGKGKKRVLGASRLDDTGAVKKARTSAVGALSLLQSDDQQDDRQTRSAFDTHRYASQMGLDGDAYHALVAREAAEHGDILRAVQYSRDLFSRRRGFSAVSKREGSERSEPTTSASGLALKNISLSISKYIAMNTEEIYNLAAQGQAHERRSLTPVELARMQAPIYSQELLQYAICVCDPSSFEETFLLLKSATLSNDILKFTQLGNFSSSKRLEADKVQIYDRWFREDALCVLPSAQTMNLATRFAIAEHRLLVAHLDRVPAGVTDPSAPIPAQDFLASKRFVSFLVENNADLLSLQVILSMRWIPEDALAVIQTQVSKLISTVFQSRKIDSFLALGLMLTMDQRDAFNAFRRQIARENVAKDFNRFQQLARIGSDSARAWQQIAFLNQCVELEGNARWWHFLNLLEIECDHKAFQSERRDLNYIRSLVPTLLAKTNYDYYTIQEFTRHYQIDDSFPALVYVEALLTTPAATSKSLEYQDKIVGVLEDIHEQRLVSLLLKTLPKIPGTDYERLLFMFQLLLEHTSYADKEEVERRIEVLHILKAFKSSDRVVANDIRTEKMSTCDAGEVLDVKGGVCFHEIMTKPREVLSNILTTHSFPILSNLDYPLRLESDELLMLLLKNVVANHRAEVTQGRIDSVSSLSGSELERLFEILASLKAVESKITAGEWLAEHLPISSHKLRALEFALEAAVASSSEGSASKRKTTSGNTTFFGVEALTRLEEKVLRTKIQLVFVENAINQMIDSARQAHLLTLLTKQPKELFYELYRSTDTVRVSCLPGRGDFSVHKIADRVASVLNLRPNELRSDLIRELLVKDAVYIAQNKKTVRQTVPEAASEEIIFSPLEHELRDARDEELISKISSIAVFVVQDSQSTDGVDAMALIEYLATLARDTKPRAGVTFRAKLRAARVVLHLAQSHPSVVVAAVEAKMKLATFDVVVKELVDYIRHCKHMIVFEENRVPYDIGFVIRSNKEALVRSLLRQHSGREEWVLRCVASLMLDFDVHAPDLWDFVLATMKQQKMFRSLSRILNGLTQHAFARSIKGASEIWESTLVSPLIYLQSLSQQSEARAIDVSSTGLSSPVKPSHEEFAGISLDRIRSELELMVGMLQKCPFLEQIDVASFVVRLRDISVSNVNSTLATIDLFTYAVRCTMVIPRPSARLEAIHRIIQSGAYMQVLNHVCDSSVLMEDPTVDHPLYADHVSEQLAILEAIFNEASKREEHEKLLGTAFEQGFLEFLALTGSIDRALAILLAEKRLEAASTLVELYYESNPERAPPGWSITEPGCADTSTATNRWAVLQQYVAASTSTHLATYRQMTS